MHTGADVFVKALESYGVTKLFGNPGTTELPISERVGESSIEYVLALHEDVAVGAAAGYASARRYHAHEDPEVLSLGVANVHVAPGLAHGLGNLHGASYTGAPLLLTAGNYSTDFQHEEPILTGDLVRMAEPFTKWAAEVKHVDALPTMLRRAVRVALTPPTGPVFLALPLDVALAETEREPERLGEIPTAGRGDAGAIERSAEAISEAESVLAVIGDGVARGGDRSVSAAVEFAEASGARVCGEYITSESSFPTDHPLWDTHLPGDASVAAGRFAEADCLVFVGCSTNTPSLRYDGRRVPAEATLIAIGDDPWELGKNEPADHTVIGDPGTVLRELANRIGERLSEDERSARTGRIESALDRRGGGGSEGESDDPRASKDDLARALAATAGEVLLVNEGVTAGAPLRRRLHLGPGQLLGNKSGGLGYGLPASIGAAFAEDERGEEGREVLGFIGDGSYLYYPNAIYTAARHDLDLTVVIADNRNYRILKDNTMRIFGGEEADHAFVATEFEPPVDLVANAESHGASARLVDDPEGLGGALEEALSDPGPTVLDVLIHD
ncbi:thiamine pyrophosphate-binding protein [Natronorarus salvus]|uniref:thiamine pyrophosphate-binding protein n=1 Tax=Natronorarus salvus TaxID=3117733 RepID=UPI002F263D53